MSNLDWTFGIVIVFTVAIFFVGAFCGRHLPPTEKQVIEAIHSYQSNAFVNAERLKRIEKALKEEK